MPFARVADLVLSDAKRRLFRTKRVARSADRTFDVVVDPVPVSELRLRLVTESTAYTLYATVPLRASNELIVKQWHRDAPPRVFANGQQINRGRGPHLVQRRPIAHVSAEGPGVTLRDRDESLFEPGERVMVFLDDRLVESLQRGLRYIVRPVVHTTHLSLGLHRAVVVAPRRSKILVDADFVVNGVHETTIEWSDAVLSDSHVQCFRAGDLIYDSVSGDLGFRESLIAATFRADVYELAIAHDVVHETGCGAVS